MVPHRVHCAVNAAFNSIGDAIGEHRLAIWFTNKNDVYGRLCQVRRLPAGARGPLCSAKTSTTYCMWARCTATRSRLRHVAQPMSTTTYEEIYRAICYRDV